MRQVVLVLAIALGGFFFAVAGALMTFAPTTFLRFHDTFVNRSASGKQAEWRKEVDTLPAKAFGFILMVLGVYALVEMMRRALAM